jgi:regulator of sigma E protease
MSFFWLVAIPIFTLMVLIHEFGHFITAKWAGIRVDEFGVGFPPRLFGIKRGETIYSINWLPIGGFVRMPGENGETTDERGNPDPRSFGAKPASKRAIVLLAGVTMNLLLAIVLFTAAEAIGRVELSSYVTVEPKGPAQMAGIRDGDHIVAIAGHPVKTFEELVSQTTTAIAAAPKNAQTLPIVVLVHHAGTTEPVPVTVQAKVQGDAHLGVRSDPAKAIHVTHPIWEAPARGLGDIPYVLGATVDGIRQIVRGVIPLNQAVQGPVGIVATTGQFAANTATIGWYPLIFLAGYLSLNLAIVNALPIPALDGGRLLFVLIEVVRRGKRLSPEREALVNLIGMGALLFLILLVTINDISNLAAGH